MQEWNEKLQRQEQDNTKIEVEAKVEDMQQQLAAQAKEIEVLKQLISQKLK